MILNNFLQNIDFSHDDFQISAPILPIVSYNICKKLEFEEEENVITPKHITEDLIIKKIESKNNNKNLLQKRIRPFNLLKDEQDDDSLNVSETNSQNNDNEIDSPHIKSIIQKLKEKLNLEEFSILKDYQSEEEETIKLQSVPHSLKRINSEVSLTRINNVLDNLSFSPGINNKFYQKKQLKLNTRLVTNSKTEMDIESPHISSIKNRLDFQKASNSAGQTKKRKLSNTDCHINSLDRLSIISNRDKTKDCFTPQLQMKNSKESLFANFSSGSQRKYGKSHYFYDNENKNNGFKINSKRVFDEFYVNEILGEGKFGIVYKCENKLDQIIYALKVVNNCYLDDKINYLEKEIPILHSQLEDTKLVKFFYSWREKNSLFLINECFPASLKNFLEERNSLSESQIRQIIKDISIGLHQLHKSGRAHLNIKPENIFYNGNSNSFKLGDLGFSSIILMSQQKDKEFVDRKYSALEFFEKSKTMSFDDCKSADVFSFGLVLYELITQQCIPSRINNEWFRIRKNIFKKLESSNKYSISLKSLITNMMKSDPSERICLERLLDENYNKIQISLKYYEEKVQNDERKLKNLEKKIANLTGKTIKRKSSIS